MRIAPARSSCRQGRTERATAPRSGWRCPRSCDDPETRPTGRGDLTASFVRISEQRQFGLQQFRLHDIAQGMQPAALLTGFRFDLIADRGPLLDSGRVDLRVDQEALLRIPARFGQQASAGPELIRNGDLDSLRGVDGAV